MSRRQRWVDQLARRNPLPTGAASVGIGLAVSGLSAYGFLAVSSRALGPQRYAPLSVLWALVYLAAPGFFLPIEQEVARAISARRVRHAGGRPVVQRAAATGAAMAAVLLAAAAAAQSPLVGRIFDGQGLLLVAFGLAVAVYLAYFLARGMLAGNGRFAAYGVIVGAEGATRMLMAMVLAIAGVRTVGIYGMTVFVSSLLALGIAMRGQHRLAEPGPPARWAEVTTSLGWLLVGSVLAQLLFNIGPLAVKALAGAGEQSAAGTFLNGLVIARIPLFFFQAVQASLLPALSAQAAAGRFTEFRHTLSRLLAAVAGVAALAVVGSAAVGPYVVRHLFGSGFELTHADMALLAAASGLYMLSLGLGQALIALAGHHLNAFGWVAGALAFAAGMSVLGGLGTVLRVEVALCVAAAAATVAMAAMLVRRMGVAGHGALRTVPGVDGNVTP
jgi:O-antigen/teichoic acid export membrane protein